MPFSGPKWPICSEQNFFGRNHYYYFHLPISPFHYVKFKKILTAEPELWQCTIFVPKMVHLLQTKMFWENYWYHSHLAIGPFHCAKFLKNSSSGCTVMRMRNFWAQNGPFPRMTIFFFFFPRKAVNEPCFFHSCPSTCQRSMSDFNLLLKYWRLKNTEISLSESLFWLNLRTRFFPSMQFSQNVNEP